MGLCPTSTGRLLAPGYGSHLPGGHDRELPGPESRRKPFALELYSFGTLVKSQSGTQNRLILSIVLVTVLTN